MQGGLGPRFALEAGFLIVLAIGAAVAQLSAGAIVAVMAVGWLLVCLFEIAVWAEGPRFPTLRRERIVVEESAPADVVEPDTADVDPELVAAVGEPQRDAERA